MSTSIHRPVTVPTAVVPGTLADRRQAPSVVSAGDAPTADHLQPGRPAAVRPSRLLDTTPEEAFERLSRLACDLLDTPFAFVTVVDEQRTYWKSRAGLTPASQSPASQFPARLTAARLTERQNPVEESFCRYVLAADRVVMIGDAHLNPTSRDNPSIDTTGVVAWAGIPVRAPDGHVLGFLCVVDAKPHRWNPRDAAILQALAHAATAEIGLRMSLDQAQAAVLEALDHAEESALLARTLQQSLLPPRLPELPGLDLAGGYLAGGRGVDVLGDFYDAVPTVDGGWSVFVGDVSGKGAQAARTTALTRYTLRAAARRHATPSRVLAGLNTALLDWFGDGLDGRFATIVYATLYPGTTSGSFETQVCTAGHPPAMIRRGDGRVETISAPGTVLGCFPEAVLHDRHTVLTPGDTLVLYTDGVTEARHSGSGDLLDEPGLRDVLRHSGSSTATHLIDAIFAAVLGYTGRSLRDDIALLAIRAPERYPSSHRPPAASTVRA